MRPIGEAGYILTVNELYILAGLTGAEVITGIDMKCACEDQEQVTAILEKAKTGLLQKKYVREHNDILKVDQNLFYLVKTCCQPVAIIRLSYIRSGNRCHRLYYFSKDVIVELEGVNHIHDVYILTPIISEQKLVHNMEECLFTEGHDWIENKMFQMPIGALHRLIINNEKFDQFEIEKQLIDLGMDKSSAVDLALPLNRHKERTILALMLNNKKQVWNSIVSGKRYLWKVEKNADKPGEVLIRVIQDKEVKSLIIQTIQNIKNNNLIQG